MSICILMHLCLYVHICACLPVCVYAGVMLLFIVAAYVFMYIYE